MSDINKSLVGNDVFALVYATYSVIMLATSIYFVL